MKTKVTAILLAGILLLSMIGNAACFAEAYPTPAQTEDPGISVLTGEAVSPAEAGSSFADVAEGTFYFDAVNWAVAQGITTGVSETAFGPTQLCNRAQVVTFLWRLDGKPAPASRDNSFTDVDVNNWYADAVLWALEKEITTGTGDGRFLPNGTCNRAQIVTFLWRYAGKPTVEDSADNPFADVDDNSWYADAVLWAVDQGITTGLTKTTFGPDEPCNRAQVVTFLYRYINAVQSDPDETEPTEPNPSEPTKPTEPTEPTKPTEPTEPTKPTEPTDPTEPSVPDWGLGGEDI